MADTNRLTPPPIDMTDASMSWQELARFRAGRKRPSLDQAESLNRRADARATSGAPIRRSCSALIDRVSRADTFVSEVALRCCAMCCEAHFHLKTLACADEIVWVVCKVCYAYDARDDGAAAWVFTRFVVADAFGAGVPRPADDFERRRAARVRAPSVAEEDAAVPEVVAAAMGVVAGGATNSSIFLTSALGRESR